MHDPWHAEESGHEDLRIHGDSLPRAGVCSGEIWSSSDTPTMIISPDDVARMSHASPCQTLQTRSD